MVQALTWINAADCKAYHPRPLLVLKQSLQDRPTFTEHHRFSFRVGQLLRDFGFCCKPHGRLAKFFDPDGIMRRSGRDWQ